MNRKLIVASSFLTLMMASPAFADDRTTATTAATTPDQIEQRGERIEQRLDRKGDRIDNRLDRKGERIEQRLDRRGDRIENRMDAKADKARAAGNEELAEHLEKKGAASTNAWIARVNA